jgi:hypothetical protein
MVASEAVIIKKCVIFNQIQTLFFVDSIKLRTFAVRIYNLILIFIYVDNKHQRRRIN